MKHFFSIDGARARAWLGQRQDGYVLLDDDVATIALNHHGHGRATLHIAEQSYDILIAIDGDRAFIHLDGRDYEIAYEAATALFEHEGESSSDSTARAPMPGSVVAIPVQTGQSVAAGDTLIVIESMKLETSIAAPRAGIVESIHVALGQTFDRDAALVTLAPLAET